MNFGDNGKLHLGKRNKSRGMPIRLLFAYWCAGTTPVFQTDLQCTDTEL